MPLPILPEFIDSTIQEAPQKTVRLIGQDFSGATSYSIVRTLRTTPLPGVFGVDPQQVVTWQIDCECEKKKKAGA